MAMKPRSSFLKFVIVAFVVILAGLSAGPQSAASVSSPTEPPGAVAYYSDNNSDRVFVVDPRNMQLLAEIPTAGSQPYPIDLVGGTKVYVSTRNSESLDIIDYNKEAFFNAGVVELTHKPRSVAYNASANLAAVSGTKKAVTSIIDVSTNEVIAVVGETEEKTPSDFGGSLATGHPFWVDDDQFLLIDRARRKVDLYKVKQRGNGRWSVRKQDSIRTPTSVHHFESVPGATTRQDMQTFYGMAEGAPADGISPSVIRVVIKNSKIRMTGKAELQHSDVSAMGSHHLGMHPDGVHIYTGSNEGRVHVINRFTMETVAVVPAGAGAGHTSFNSATGVAVQTNHRAEFMTLIDMDEHTLIGTVDIASEPTPTGSLAQSHTTSFDPSNPGVFYTSAAADGVYVEVDATSGAVTRTLPLDPGNGYTIQGTYNWNFGH